MKAGKKTYIKRVREIFKDLEEVDCVHKIGMATEQVCLKIDTLVNLKVSYSPYQEHTFELKLVGGDSEFAVILQFEIYKYQNIFKDTPKREFETKNEFNDYIDMCVSYVEPTIKQLKNHILEYIREKISQGKTMKRLLEDLDAIKYIVNEFDLTPEELSYLYEKSGNEQFLPQSVKDMFLF